MSKQYKNAMDKIVLSDSLKEKIISDMAYADKSAKSFKKSNTKIFYLRTIACAAACLCLCIGGFSVIKNFSAIKPLPDTPQTEFHNPAGNSDHGKDENAQAGTQNPLDKTDFTKPETRTSPNDSTKDNTEISKPSFSAPQDEPTGENPPLMQNPDNENGQNPSDKTEQNPNVGNGQNPDGEYEPPVMGGSPYEDFADIASLENKLGYSLKVPSYLPNGYNLENITLIFGTLAEITYSNGQSYLTFRTEQNAEDDISDVYDTFEAVKEVKINDITACLKGNGEKINLALFKDGASYALFSQDGINEDEIIKIIAEIA